MVFEVDKKDIGPAAERVRAPKFDLNTPGLIRCPYNPSHRILPSRLQIHLKRCRSYYGSKGLEVCLFNYCHHVPKVSYHIHLEVNFDYCGYL